MTQKTSSSFTICQISALEINYFPVLLSVCALLARLLRRNKRKVVLGSRVTRMPTCTFRVRNRVRNRVTNRVRNRVRNRVGPTFIGLVVQHKERDIYFDATGIRRLSSEANRYYHRQWECLKARHPYISTPMIRIDPVLLLDDYQRHCLESLLGLSY